jgi:hypothetical protein
MPPESSRPSVFGTRFLAPIELRCYPPKDVSLINVVLWGVMTVNLHDRQVQSPTLMPRTGPVCGSQP